MTNNRNSALQERLDFMRIDEETSMLLRGFWPDVDTHLKEILDGFYDHVSGVPALKTMFGNHISRLKKEQHEHWKRLFSGRFDDAYFEGVHKIGLIHNKIGLEPRWYIGGYNYVLSKLTTLAIQKHKWSTAKGQNLIRAINCAVMLDMDIAISTYQEALLEDRARRGQKLDEMMRAFETKVLAMIEDVASAAYKLQDTSTGLTKVASDTITQATTVASAAEEASVNVQTVASAAEELSSSVTEISRQASQSSHIAGKAVAETERTNQVVTKLAEGAQKIGDIVSLISDIAGQTNLLALNATIEAARAGEMGKGFAVVASEVKNLATQTGRATDEITQQINEIQASTQDAVKAIQGITQIINEIGNISGAIAAAVEEQGSATKEIARNVAEASQGTRLVTSSIGNVSEGANETGKAAGQVSDAAKSLSHESESLSKEVQNFLMGAKAV